MLRTPAGFSFAPVKDGEVIDPENYEGLSDGDQKRGRGIIPLCFKVVLFDRLNSRVHEAIMRGTLMIDTSGGQVGQVNGLSVSELGGHAFAEPTRIIATTRSGEGHVIDVQREVEFGDAMHSKDVLILSSFLAARYSQNQPHALSASLVFEQPYGIVEWDSASLAELCALMSSLPDVPIDGRSGASNAVEAAVRLTSALDARLTALFLKTQTFIRAAWPSTCCQPDLGAMHTATPRPSPSLCAMCRARAAGVASARGGERRTVVVPALRPWRGTHTPPARVYEACTG